MHHEETVDWACIYVASSLKRQLSFFVPPVLIMFLQKESLSNTDTCLLNGYIRVLLGPSD